MDSRDFAFIVLFSDLQSEREIVNIEQLHWNFENNAAVNQVNKKRQCQKRRRKKEEELDVGQKWRKKNNMRTCAYTEWLNCMKKLWAKCRELQVFVLLQRHLKVLDFTNFEFLEISKNYLFSKSYLFLSKLVDH